MSQINLRQRLTKDELLELIREFLAQRIRVTSCGNGELLVDFKNLPAAVEIVASKRIAASFQP